MNNMNDDDEAIVEFVRSDYDSSSHRRARPQCRQDLVEQDITTERLHENQQHLVLGIRGSTDQKSNNKNNQKLSSTQDIHRTHMNQQTTLDVEIDEVQQQTQQQRKRQEDPLRQATVTIPRHHDRNAEVEYDSNGNLVIAQHQESMAIENADDNPAAYVLPPFSPPTPISQILIFGSDNSRTLIHLPTPSSTASLSSSSDDDDISSPWNKQVACRLGCKSEDFGKFSQSRTAKEEAVQQQYSSTQQHTMTSLTLGSVPGTAPSWGNQHDANVDSLDTGVHLR